MSEHFEWLTVRDRVLSTRCEPHGVTVGLVVGDEGAALIDTGSTPQQGADLLASAAKAAGVPVSHVVITHGHHDHWLGLAGMTDVISVGHENLLAAATAAEIADEVAAAGLSEAPRVAQTFSLASVIELGGVRLELINLGDAHTSSDCYVVVPDQGVVFAGDLLESSGDPQFGPTTSARNWPTVLDGLIAVCDDDTIILPGHGEPMDRYAAIRQQADLAIMYGAAESLGQRGVDLAEAADATEWPFAPETVAAALPGIYADLASRGVKKQLPLSWA